MACQLEQAGVLGQDDRLPAPVKETSRLAMATVETLRMAAVQLP